jgi:hypothetical protein
MTGLSNLLVGDFSGKWVKLLKEVVPRVRMALLWNPDTIPAANVKPVQDAAKALRVRLDLFEVRSSNDFNGAFEVIRENNVGGLIVNPDPLTVRHRARIVELAAKSKDQRCTDSLSSCTQVVSWPTDRTCPTCFAAPPPM